MPIESSKLHRRDKVRGIEFEEHIVSASRVCKVVKGGRIFSFSVLVVIGNKNGYVGIGLGKALEVSEARRKAINNAKNNLYYITLSKTKTIPHEVKGKFGASRVNIRPAKPGTGIIAGSVMRAAFESIGIKDIVAKSLNSSNPHNILKATIKALLLLKDEIYYKSLSTGLISGTIDDNDDE